MHILVRETDRNNHCKQSAGQIRIF